jgi:hypothetical protein
METTLTTEKRINLTVTQYDGDQPFPEAEHYDEFCLEQIAALYPGFAVECGFGPRTEAHVYGADLDGRDLEHEISSMLKVDLWDQFCTDGYKAYAAAE